MKNLILISVSLLFIALCSADKVGVGLPISGLMLSVVLTIVGLVFAPRIFTTKKSSIAPYILAWFYAAFMTTAAIGANGNYLELARALYIFSGIIFVAGMAICYVLHRRNLIFSKEEFTSVFIVYFVGFSLANVYAGFF